ncbi:hypothetical protein ACTSKR_11460 [Chitinibacteraceae bacterium HSL-7]
MSHFAKLFTFGDDQVLVTLNFINDDDRPELRFHTQLTNQGMRSVAAMYDDTQEGRAKARAAFEAADEEMASAMLNSFLMRLDTLMDQGGAA